MTEMCVLNINENRVPSKFTIQVVEERMKVIEKKNVVYGIFYKNIFFSKYLP
jgi:hypothetical protein